MINEPIRTLIVDDEPLARRAMRHLLADDDDILIIGECGNGREAVGRIGPGDVDLVFLDIRMPDLSGFEVLREVEQPHRPAVVFVTAFDDRAVEAFEAEAVDYVVKPIDQDRFTRAVHRAKRRLRGSAAAELGRKIAALMAGNTGLAGHSDGNGRAVQRIPLKACNRTLFVDPATILWIESADMGARLHSRGANHTLRETMARLEEVLPAERFVRIHRSYFVNLDHVREVQPLFHGDFVVIMDDGAELRLSRTRRKSFERRLGRTL